MCYGQLNWARNNNNPHQLKIPLARNMIYIQKKGILTPQFEMIHEFSGICLE